MTSCALAVDAGQTGIKVRLANGEGDRTFDFAGIRTDRPLIPQLAGVVVAVVEETGLDIDVVSFGVSGLTAQQTEPEQLLSALRPFRVREVYLAHDSITAYLGAMGDRPGAVVASGTGVVTLGVGSAGVARVDGWGYLIGDAGSGYSLGRAALDAVLRAHDGRGAATALTERVQREFPDLEAAYVQLQSDEGRVRRIAAYAAVVAELAPTDVVAAAIIRAAGAELALSALTALRRAGEHVNPRAAVRGIGGVFRSPELGAAFAEAVRETLPEADIRPGDAHPLDGAALLPSIVAGNPLHAHIATARA
ncbi:BadF/BadG/BcrA/BcrD ATPase family protein [Rathayibacter sp. YIM 133350]|uniref:N-acetylglucosamine kinase n=1 Tax=Rathayibacter sp. YIM 133350 TaxID=3131992 RepID=UPI00307DC222